MPAFKISTRLLRWFDAHGRHDLPWQKKISPYRVWISEIMLQQTQVSTVIPYFHRFMEAFPSLTALAKAPLDEVLHLWTGLGYYARARNLHKAAQKIVREFKGKFPDALDTLMQLPGIGRSTAGAILSIAFQKRAPILDGNVRRVLSRLHCVEGAPNDLKTQTMLWRLAEEYTPSSRFADYTQAIMDLGATLCTRTQPDCTRCPLKKNCEAFTRDRVKEFPQTKRRKKIRSREVILVILQNKNGEVLLEQQPAEGIWGGLWSLPEYRQTHDKLPKKERRQLPSFRHTFTHFHLEVTPILITLSTAYLPETDQAIWYKIHGTRRIGLPAPIKKLLESL